MRRIGGTAIARKLLRDPPYATARGRIAGQLGEILAPPHGDLGTLRAGAPRSRRPHRGPAPLARPAGPAAAGLRAGALLARPAQARADGQAGAGPWRLPHRQLPGRRIGRDRDPRLGRRASRRSDRGSGLAVREELALRRGRQAGRRLRQPRGAVGAYQRAGGAKVDPARAHWWEVFGTVRWGIICHNQAFRHLSGSIKSMELASIGRRAVETEVDLLQLLKSGGEKLKASRRWGAALAVARLCFNRRQEAPLEWRAA